MLNGSRRVLALSTIGSAVILGTPFLNAKGEISSVLIATPNGPLEFAVADEIRMFVAAAAGMSPWPTLRQRPSVSI